MLLRVLLSILFLSSSSETLVPVFHTNDSPKSIANIINRFLVPLTTKIDFMIAFKSESQKLLQLDTLNGLLPHLELTTTVSLCGFWGQTHSMFFLADSHMSFRKALLSSESKQYELMGYFLVYLTDRTDNEDLSKIFKDCLEHHIINVGVMYPFKSLSNDVILYTYFPFSSESCFNHDPFPLCIYRDDVLITGDRTCSFYPNKMSNFYGCELIIDAYEMVPFLTLNRDSEGKVTASGLEGEVLNILASKLNFTTSFIASDRTKTSDIFQSFTSGPANVSVGRLRSTTMRRRNVSSSTAYYKSDLKLIVHLGRPLYSLERLFSPASKGIWLSFIIIVSLAYTVVLIVYMKCPIARRMFILGAGNQNPIYWVYVTTLGGPAEYKPGRNFARYILLQWIAFNFFLRSGYQAFFYKSIRMDWKTYPANSLEEVLTNEFQIIGTAETLRCLSDINQVNDRVGRLNGSEMEALQNLETSQENVVLIAPYEVFRYYKRQVTGSNLTTIKEPVLEQMICMNFRTNSYFREPFDRNLQLLGVSGLLKHWWAVHVAKPERLDLVTISPKKLKLSDVVGHFQVYAFAIVISFICLAVELLSLKVRFLRRVFLDI